MEIQELNNIRKELKKKKKWCSKIQLHYALGQRISIWKTQQILELLVQNSKH